MAKEYVVVSYIKRNGDPATKLIGSEALKGEDGKIRNFLESGCREIREVGVVQVLGGTDYLDDVYTSQ